MISTIHLNCMFCIDHLIFGIPYSHRMSIPLSIQDIFDYPNQIYCILYRIQLIHFIFYILLSLTHNLYNILYKPHFNHAIYNFSLFFCIHLYHQKSIILSIKYILANPNSILHILYLVVKLNLNLQRCKNL